MNASRPDAARSSVQLPETSALGLAKRELIEPATVLPATSTTTLAADVTDAMAVPNGTTFSSPVSAPCVDLQTVFGARFKVRTEADGATWFENPEPERVWLLEIPCKYGVVYPYGCDILAAAITSRRIGTQVVALPGIRSSRGDVERVVTFHLGDAEAVLDLLRPRRRRSVAPEERERLRAMGRVHGAVGLARARRQRRHGRPDLSKALENDLRIDAPVETDLGPVPGLSDSGDAAGDAQSPSGRRPEGRRS